jgi:predicted O-methyltransferase YrrM
MLIGWWKNHNGIGLMLHITKKYIKNIPWLFHRLKSLEMRFQLELHNRDDQIQVLTAQKRYLRLPDLTCLMDIESGMAGHQLFLFNLAREINAKKVLEIGLGMANSTLAFLLAMRETEGCLVTIEINPMPEAVNRVKATGLHQYWQLMSGSSQQLRQQISHEISFDILFIDGYHSYNQCKLDYKLYSPLVRKGGYIIFHDSSTISGIIKFTNELKRRYHETITFPYCNGIFVLRK